MPRPSGIVQSPARARAFAEAPVASRPAIINCPADGRNIPLATLISVLFPAPLGPSKATTSPRPTVRFTPCSTSIDPYEARTFRSSRIGVLTTGLRGRPVKLGDHVECIQGCHER